MSEQAAQLQTNGAEDLARLAGNIDKLETVVAGWDDHYQLSVAALKNSI